MQSDDLLRSSSSQIMMSFKPITKHIDESGKVVYKLGHYLAQHFKDIFEQVDRDLEGHGIKAYVIKNMTLEQVFLAIGE